MIFQNQSELLLCILLVILAYFHFPPKELVYKKNTEVGKECLKILACSPLKQFVKRPCVRANKIANKVISCNKPEPNFKVACQRKQMKDDHPGGPVASPLLIKQQFLASYRGCCIDFQKPLLRKLLQLVFLCL